MIKLLVTRRFLYAGGVVLFAAMTLIFLSRSVRAGQDNQQGQQQGQQDQNQGQSQQQEKPKKKGGFFGGLKAITGSNSEQTSATASAGSKGVGEGEKIGNVTPTPADRMAVTLMETYSVPPSDLTKFIQDGHLKGKQ
jgi:transcription initiation factor TFIID subunit TAF12